MEIGGWAGDEDDDEEEDYACCLFDLGEGFIEQEVASVTSYGGVIGTL